ncbi:hypothetical protein SAMN02927921_04093 [Sinomicrobium oceani]|uniref:Uncharacterized protein n=1 Tax=Sinomicrobium oceani TaxID=1150368 RepID=A0A1K1RWN3_9FLAO|nr:hypothetical protein [Sinomicrobium oceani]SFW76221.1 hypothetical protein SAMN02927921_04093 [Sinomicrobium oceani]
MKKVQLSIWLKMLLILVCLTPLVLLFSSILVPNLFDNRSFEERFLERERKKECIGIIDSIYHQKKNHNILTLKVNQCIYEITPLWENKFQVGDSISKKRGELIIEHYRNGTLMDILKVKL